MKHFGGCPVIRVPGLAYNVETFYLEDVLSVVNTTEKNHLTRVENDQSYYQSESSDLDGAIDSALSKDEFDPLLELLSSEGDPRVYNYKHSETGVTPLMVFSQKGRVGDIHMLLSFGVDRHLQSNEGKTAFDYAKQYNQKEAAEIIEEHIDYDLIEKLISKICRDSKDGAILVFLPGWDDINKTREKLEASPFFKDSSKVLIISLHSKVPSVEQKKVFERPPRGCRKIVLSTNITETSVTIEDVVYVIDSGQMKEKSYNPYKDVYTLRSSWVSKASAKQREGRAGRCQAGFCYHLYSKMRDASLLDFQVPEIKRMPIEELCLQVMLMDPTCNLVDFVKENMLDPPVCMTIRNAIKILQGIGALTVEEKLTDLGEKLGSLPVHPRTSKMLCFAILLNCLDPALTLACASDYKDPFILPMLPHEKKRARSARAELASFYGGNGDQLAVIAAFDRWKMAKAKGEETWFCSQFFVSSDIMNSLSGMRKKLERELQRHGFIPQDTTKCSLNARNPGILLAVISAGLYPVVGRVIRQGRRLVAERSWGLKVRLHSHSSNMTMSFKKIRDRPLIVFDEITRGNDGHHIRNCDVIGPLHLMLLATDFIVAPIENYEDETEDVNRTEGSSAIMASPENIVKVVVDEWLPFESMARDAAQICCLRERLSAAILFKVTHPQDVLPEHLGASLYATACILSYDGMSGISLSLEAEDQPPRNNNYLKSLMYHQHNYGSHYQHQNHASEGAGQVSATYRTTTSRGNFSMRPRGNGLR